MVKKSLFALMSVGILMLTACGTQTPKAEVSVPEEDQGFSFQTEESEEGVKVTVLKGGSELGSLRLQEGEWDVSVYTKGPRYTFFGASPSGMGGYIVFAGPSVLARYDSVTEDFSSKDFSRSEYPAVVAGVSADGEKVAYTMTTESGVKMVIANDLFEANADAPIYEVPGEFSQAGGASFSEEGSHLAYVAASGPEDEKTAVFVVDLVSGEQTELARRDVSTENGIFSISTWAGNAPKYQ
jgi:hypothetical protein